MTTIELYAIELHKNYPVTGGLPGPTFNIDILQNVGNQYITEGSFLAVV
jgi:hypothetical protein